MPSLCSAAPTPSTAEIADFSATLLHASVLAVLIHADNTGGILHILPAAAVCATLLVVSAQVPLRVLGVVDDGDSLFADRVEVRSGVDFPVSLGYLPSS